MAETKRWIVTVRRGDPTRPISKVAEEITDAGFTIDPPPLGVQDAIGIITGSATEDVKDAVLAIRGVLKAEEELIVDIGPPDEE